ncbi:MAG TPA: hypothetical protein VF815_36315 [Myxococcaceae bacterium]|jgi:hypothetical protein
MISMVTGFIWESHPSLTDAKNYLEAIADAGRFRIDAFDRQKHLAYTFLCKFRAGTSFFHGSKLDFTNNGAVQILRGSFFTTWLEYAQFLLWTTFSAANNTDDPHNAVVLEYQAPNNVDFFYVNSRLFMNQLLTNTKGRHNVADNANYADNVFPANRNYGVHSKIFCKSTANYGVAGMGGVIQGVSATNMDMAGVLSPLLGNNTRQQDFLQLCTAVGGQRERSLRAGFDAAWKAQLNTLDRRVLAEFEEIYWNDRQNPTNQHTLPNLPPLAALNRQDEYRNYLAALLNSDQPGHQYCFDYRTYGPLLTTNDERGVPVNSSPLPCLTALCRSRAELHQMSDNLLDCLRDNCTTGIKQTLYTRVRRLVTDSSARALTTNEIDVLRETAFRLRVQLM